MRQCFKTGFRPMLLRMPLFTSRRPEVDKASPVTYENSCSVFQYLKSSTLHKRMRHEIQPGHALSSSRLRLRACNTARIPAVVKLADGTAGVRQLPSQSWCYGSTREEPQQSQAAAPNLQSAAGLRQLLVRLVCLGARSSHWKYRQLKVHGACCLACSWTTCGV